MSLILRDCACRYQLIRVARLALDILPPEALSMIMHFEVSPIPSCTAGLTSAKIGIIFLVFFLLRDLKQSGNPNPCLLDQSVNNADRVFCDHILQGSQY